MNETVYTSTDDGRPSFFHELRAMFPCLDEQVTHPETGDREYVHSIVIDLNDEYGWTRHQIADWLEEIPVDISRSDANGYSNNASLRGDGSRTL